MAANAEMSLLFHNRNEMLHLDHMYESTQTDEQYQMQYFPAQRKTELGDSFTQFSFGEHNLGNFDNDNNISFEQGLGESSDGSTFALPSWARHTQEEQTMSRLPYAPFELIGQPKNSEFSAPSVIDYHPDASSKSMDFLLQDSKGFELNESAIAVEPLQALHEKPKQEENKPFQSEAKWTAGDKVEAKYHDDKHWYGATIVEVLSEEEGVRYKIAWDDGEGLHDLLKEESEVRDLTSESEEKIAEDQLNVYSPDELLSESSSEERCDNDAVFTAKSMNRKNTRKRKTAEKKRPGTKKRKTKQSAKAKTQVAAVRRAISKAVADGFLEVGATKQRFKLTDAGKQKIAPPKPKKKKKKVAKKKRASKKKRKKTVKRKSSKKKKAKKRTSKQKDVKHALQKADNYEELKQQQTKWKIKHVQSICSNARFKFCSNINQKRLPIDSQSSIVVAFVMNHKINELKLTNEHCRYKCPFDKALTVTAYFRDVPFAVVQIKEFHALSLTNRYVDGNFSSSLIMTTENVKVETADGSMKTIPQYSFVTGMCDVGDGETEMSAVSLGVGVKRKIKRKVTKYDAKDGRLVEPYVDSFKRVKIGRESYVDSYTQREVIRKIRKSTGLMQLRFRRVADHVTCGNHTRKHTISRFYDLLEERLRNNNLVQHISAEQMELL